jgi:dynein heavy chain
VTDDWDRLLLMSILKKFYTHEILEDEYKFSDSPFYYAPKLNSLEGFKDFIDNLPSEDDPEIFGMHNNANITYQQQESDKIIGTIL